jgi:hypothetical protein
MGASPPLALLWRELSGDDPMAGKTSEDNEELNDVREVGHVESEAGAVQRETLAWSESLRLSQPGYQPVYGDLLAALANASQICARMVAEPDNTPAEKRYLESLNTRIDKLSADAREHHAVDDE